MRWASWVNFVLGLWLIVSPFAFGHPYGSPGVIANDVVVGIIIAALSLWMAALYDPPVLVSWLVAFLGLWTVIAWVFYRYNGQPPAVTANGIAIGIVVFILALVRALRIGRRIAESR